MSDPTAASDQNSAPDQAPPSGVSPVDAGFAHPTEAGIVLPNAYVETNHDHQEQLGRQSLVWQGTLAGAMTSPQMLRLHRVMQMFPGHGETTRYRHSMQAADFVTTVTTQVHKRISGFPLSMPLAQVIASQHDDGHFAFGHEGEIAATVALRYLGDSSDELSHSTNVDLLLADQDFQLGHVHKQWPTLALHPVILDGLRNHSWSRPPGASLEANLVKLADRAVHTADDFAAGLTNGLIPAEHYDLAEALFHRPTSMRKTALSDELRKSLAHEAASVLIEHGVVGLPRDTAHVLYQMRLCNQRFILGTPERKSWQHHTRQFLLKLMERSAEEPSIKALASERHTSVERTAIECVAVLDDSEAMKLGREFGLTVPEPLVVPQAARTQSHARTSMSMSVA